MNVFDQLLGFRRKGLPLDGKSLPITDLESPPRLNFTLSSTNGTTWSALVNPGDEIQSGQPLWGTDTKQMFPSPVTGKVSHIVNVPDIRGQRVRPSIVVEPSNDTSATVFPSLNPNQASIEELAERIADAGLQTDSVTPSALSDRLSRKSGEPLAALIILGVDREPNISALSGLVKERGDDLIAAVRLLEKISGASRTIVAFSSENDAAAAAIRSAGIEVLAVLPQYPGSLDVMIAEQAGLNSEYEVISIETALSALDAVQLGQLPDSKVLTVIGPKNQVLGNYRVKIGTQISGIFSQLHLKPGQHDKVIAGGPMRGVAQYSLDGAVDSSTNALMLIPQVEVVEWTADPCINCGNCIDACPRNLQVQMIGRYSEFGLFDRTRELQIEECIDCGLCASVCIAGRPLLQYINLAKTENAKEAVASDEPSTEESQASGPPPVNGNDPALSIFAGGPKFTVGFAPHFRTRASIAKMNLAFIMALLPTILFSAASHFYGPDAANISAAVGPATSLAKTLLLELGLDAGFLWFSGVLGSAVFGLGFGVLVEYICQVVMRQPYHVVNGHGALMGLFIALLMPPTAPLWIMAVAIIVAIFIGKQIFGGIGGYPMHPAMIGWLVVLLSWPQYVHPIGSATIAAASSTVIIVTLVGGIALWLSGYIRIEIPAGVLIGVVVAALLFQNQLDGSVMQQILTGHIILAAFFLGTDSTCSPANKRARWLYGFGLGFLIILIRAFGVWSDAVPFAVILMNVLFPLIDRLKPKVIKGAI
ncbi:MAG: 4Fe-4S dicluster domain-containing protein [Deltaproteobacteria bacterium]|jgi:Na+-translocating ferredoxin:NAD+ oxidoreductase RnfC subunit/Na+-translocating ferredoxin:NAD+ oxidoreductase RnfD subunit|nr:4Fe-4S dicluster domain-containing protein [Deltaproteobacteria bacterium]MBT6502356.1 4Fe-4S dicluster domain-containing protein [Deltaproteobacteria bacterium]MBT7155855.1 4Fe-4S dicluster domain-containing protein [Deltaproteobacteria bacterium]MBT7711645.1 4Fe-4S dicluster domain-containing protein [Deltaproteobacteria bacterium]MBT7890493.1 4Fe-4S dicluster domain-containing protein [Deltaproteobacteria bacterium]